MAKHHDLAGLRFGKLTLVSYEGVNKNRQALWKAACDCGGTTVVLANKVRRGAVKSCGCGAVNKPLELTGQRFGRLTVIARSDKRVSRAHIWRCLCDCGQEISVPGPKLKFGHTLSCGCLKVEHASNLNKTHGKAGSGRHRTYSVWCRMKQRCSNPKTSGWANYGGRGITVCQEWQDSYEAFLRDMGEAPDGLTIERINNDLGYYKENCRWATKKEQAENQRPRKDLKVLPDGRRVKVGGRHDPEGVTDKEKDVR